MRARIGWIALAMLAASPARAGPLLDKALAYDARMQAVHLPGHGCRVEVRWADDALTVPEVYFDLGDASEWTAGYIVAESLRYAVTGDPQAKANGLRSLGCLLLLERATPKIGYIARFVAPDEGPYAPSFAGECASGHCGYVESGPLAGERWIGDTSSDMYIGWWYGMLFAWDYLLDSPAEAPLRAEVRAATARVLETLRAVGYLIVNPDGGVSGSGPEIVGNERIAFHLAAAAIHGGAYAEELPKVYAENLFAYAFSTWAPITRWYQYYAFLLGAHLQHMLLAAETSWPLLRMHRDLTRRNFHLPTRDTGQVEFDYISWGERADKPTPERLAAAKRTLQEFPSPPRLKIHPDQGPWTPDPTIALINTLGPLLAPLFGGEWKPLAPQALDPFPMSRRCVVANYWERSPYGVCDPAESDPRVEYPGHDYLEAYWMGRYYGFLTEED
ncbi:MAG: hypothetical protein K8I02_03030 [Candidatus Methylomirabilis sp.]|nr:hypothetical protein [Deltaproteobacteria bacterium]